MRTHLPANVRHAIGIDVLGLLLVATLLAPFPAAVLRLGVRPAFGLTLLELAATVCTLALGYILWHALAIPGRGLVHAGRMTLLAAALSVVFAIVIAWRRNGFFTAEALFQGTFALFVLHLVDAGLRRAGRLGRRADGPDRPVTATSFAESLVTTTTMLVVGFWLLTLIAQREAALVLLLFAAACTALGLLFRVPDVARRIGFAPALLLAAVGLASCGPGIVPGPLTFGPAADGAACGSSGTSERAIPARGPGVAAMVAPASAPRREDGLALRLNIPAYRLDALVDAIEVGSWPVAVGMRRYRTPVGSYRVQQVVWNPWWHPPDSPWARDERITPPGPDNPMGRVKLLLGGPYYVHGSPFVSSIGRAASHGCVRLRDEDAIALAQLVLAYGGASMSDSAIAAALADSLVSRAVSLPRPVPLAMVYELAEVRGDSLLLHPDIYRRAGGRARALAMLALQRAGRDTTALRARVLATALRRARARRVAVPLDSLVIDTATAPVVLH